MALAYIKMYANLASPELLESASFSFTFSSLLWISLKMDVYNVKWLCQTFVLVSTILSVE